MRRADRLFRIVQRLRRRGATTARHLAEALEVSERTVYRDIRDLLVSGVPIQGEAGVGYALDRSYELPPLMFDEEEIEALVLGARIVRAWADKKLARAAEEALQKIETVLPSKLKSRLAESALRDAKRLPQLPAGPDRRAADSRGPVRGRAGADARRLPRAGGRRGAGRGEFGRSAALRTSMSDRGHPRLSSRA